MKCRACCEKVPDGLYMKCTKEKCQQVYDFKCLGWTLDDFYGFSNNHEWMCPECVCSKPKRNDPDTPVRSTTELKAYTPSANINTQRGSRVKTTDATVNSDNHSISINEFREFKLEVLKRLDVQTEIIKHLQEVCSSTKTELEELKTHMRVHRDECVSSQYKDNINSASQSIKADDEEPNSIVIPPSTFAEVTRKDSMGSTKEKNIHTRKSAIKTNGATKIASMQSGVAVSTLVNPNKKISVVNLNSEEEGPNEWTEVRRKKGKFHSKNVKKGSNIGLVGIQATEKNKHLHVWRLASETTDEELISHVKNICGPAAPVKVEKIKHKTERGYASFVVTIPESKYEILCQPEVWPVNAEFCEWIWFRRSGNTAKSY